LAKFGSFGQF
jgi:hypothetical protein